MPKTPRHTGCRANKTSTPLATWQRCSKEETVHFSSLTYKTAKPFNFPSSGVTPLVAWRVSTAYQRTPNPIPNHSALVSACFVFCLSRLCKDPCLCPWKLAESRRRNVRLARCPQRPSDQNPSCCCTRLRALSLMHKPFPNVAMLRAVRCWGLAWIACGLTSLAYLYLIPYSQGFYASRVL
jgi:hypothetical protein